LKAVFLLSALLLSAAVISSPAQAQQPEVSIPIGITSDAGDASLLRMGLDPSATSDIDASIGEAPAPPASPGGFDVRFESDNLDGIDLGDTGAFPYDFRQGDASTNRTVEYELAIEPGDATTATLAWTLPEGVTGTLQDILDGVVVGPIAMTGTGSATVSSFSLNLVISLTFDGTQAPTDGTPSTFAVDSATESYNFRDTGVSIDFKEVSGSGLVTVERFNNAPEGAPPSGFADLSAYRWVVEQVDGSLTFGDQTEFRIDASAPEALGISDEGGDGFEDDIANVTVLRRPTPGEGDFSTELTTTYDSAEEVLVATGFTGFSEFVLASTTEPLPVELSAFDAQATGEAVSLTWHTASETNNAGFEVQRRSGRQWEALTFVEGAGTTARPHAYRFRDAAPPFADSLVYRLKQIDTDGTSAFSPEVVVRRGPGAEVQLAAPFPNPTRQQATVRYVVPEGSAQPVRLTVYNVLGQRVATLVDETKAPGRETLTVDTARWSSGVYFLRLQVGETMRSQRVTVVR
jgi:hypothetical protein